MAAWGLPWWLSFCAGLADYYFIEPRGTLLSNNNLE